MVDERVAQFRDQTRRFLAGQRSEEEFRPLRLRNGLYIQRHAPMLRVAIPYGLLSARQLRMLARIARTYDRGYGHFTTRQNIQYNWPALERVPDILADLATVQMHAIQTSGNCIRNVTSDQLAGVAADEIVDPRPYCELMRQWSTLHQEFTFLPRKFKIAISGAANDRAALMFHDIGLKIVRNSEGATGFRVYVGGGQGRTPYVAKELAAFVPRDEILSYLEATMRAYNLHGRRDNIHKARIKILLKAWGREAFAEAVEAEWARRDSDALRLPNDEIARIAAHFAPPAYAPEAAADRLDPAVETDPDFARWYARNTLPHKVPGYRAVHISLKSPGRPPGDATADEMDLVADLAERYSFGELRVTHHQNLLLADVRLADLPVLWQALRARDLAYPNVGTLTDMIACPGLDFCSLANAGSIDVARQIQSRFEDLDYLYDLGELRLNMSGCMNACGHHHVGHIGILGVDKKGEEWYQIQIGGSSANDASLGKVLGPSVPKEQVAEVIGRLLGVYLELREEGERFLDTCRRVGIEPFRDRVYAELEAAA